MSEIKLFGEPVLGKVCVKVENVSEVSEIIEELWEVVNSVKGAGLSANQIGYDVSVAVINNIGDNDCFTIINPEIIEFYGDTMSLEEGCLSIPGVVGNVKRHLSLKLKYLNEEGVECVEYFVGNSAHIIQHEVEHLNGKVYIDNYGSIRRESMIKKHKKALKKASK